MSDNGRHLERYSAKKNQQRIHIDPTDSPHSSVDTVFRSLLGKSAENLSPDNGPFYESENNCFSSKFKRQLCDGMGLDDCKVQLVWFTNTEQDESLITEWLGYILVDVTNNGIPVQLRISIAIARDDREQRVKISLNDRKASLFDLRKIEEYVAVPSANLNIMKSQLLFAQQELTRQLASIMDQNEIVVPWSVDAQDYLDNAPSSYAKPVDSWEVVGLQYRKGSSPSDNNDEQVEVQSLKLSNARVVLWSNGELFFEGVETSDYKRVRAVLDSNKAFEFSLPESKQQFRLEFCDVPRRTRLNLRERGAVLRWNIRVKELSLISAVQSTSITALELVFCNSALTSELKFSACDCDFEIHSKPVNAYIGDTFSRSNNKHPLGVVNGRLRVVPKTSSSVEDIRAIAHAVLNLLTLATGALTPVVTEKSFGDEFKLVGFQVTPNRAALNTSASMMFSPSDITLWQDFMEEALPKVMTQSDVLSRLDVTARQWGAINLSHYVDTQIGQTTTAFEGLCRYIAVTKLSSDFIGRYEGTVLVGVQTNSSSNVNKAQLCWKDDLRFSAIRDAVYGHFLKPVLPAHIKQWKNYRHGFAHHGSLHEYDQLFEDAYIPLRRELQSLILSWIGWKGTYIEFASN